MQNAHCPGGLHRHVWEQLRVSSTGATRMLWEQGFSKGGPKSSFKREWTYDVGEQYVATDCASGLSSMPSSACESCCSHAHLPGRTLKAPSLISPSLLSCRLRCLTLWVDISIWLFYSVLKLDEPHAQLPSTLFLSLYLITSAAVFGFHLSHQACFQAFWASLCFYEGPLYVLFQFWNLLWHTLWLASAGVLE